MVWVIGAVAPAPVLGVLVGVIPVGLFAPLMIFAEFEEVSVPLPAEAARVDALGSG